MTMPLKNLVFEKIRISGNLTDSDLIKILAKADIVLPEDEFNKILLDLEISGLIKVSWLTKDERRIEIIEKETEIDEIEEQNQEKLERDYEAGFPGIEQDQQV